MHSDLSTVLSAVKGFFARIFAGRTPRAGMDISDQAIRMLFERKGSWQLETVALTPGILERGTIRDRAAFAQALSALHAKVAGGDPRSRLGVHISLSSAPSYIQLVAIPPVAPSELSSAVQLNVQVSAPVALSELAWGWQRLPGAAGNAAVLAAWIARPTVDAIVSTLAETGFLPASLEPKAMSVARLVRSLAPEATRAGAYLLTSLDETGITLAVLDSGVVRFQYVRTWSEVRGTRAEVAYASLDELIRREAVQVTGFYAQRGGVRLTEVLIATPVFQEELIATLTSLGFTVRTLAIGTPPFPLAGYGAYGAALRGGILTGGDDLELSLLGEQIRDWVRRELAVRVSRFWTIFLPASLALLLLTYGAAYLFITNVQGSLSSFQGSVPPALLAELADRETRVNAFNEKVTTIRTLQSKIAPRAPQLQNLLAHAQRSGVTVTRLTLVPTPERSTVSGVVGGESQLLSFKRALEGDPTITRVQLPVTEVKAGPDGISFSMTFETSFAPLSNTTP